MVSILLYLPMDKQDQEKLIQCLVHLGKKALSLIKSCKTRLKQEISLLINQVSLLIETKKVLYLDQSEKFSA